MKLFIEKGAVEYMSEQQLNHYFKEMIKEDGLGKPNYVVIQSFVEQCARFNRLSQRFYPIHILLKMPILGLEEQNLIKFLFEMGSPIDAIEDGLTCLGIALSRSHRFFQASHYVHINLFQTETRNPEDILRFLKLVEDPTYKNPYYYLNMRCVRNYNTLLHEASESNLVQAKLILDKVATLPLQARIMILTAKNANNLTPLDILYKQLEELQRLKISSAVVVEKSKVLRFQETAGRRLATDVVAESEVVEFIRLDFYAEESELPLETLETKVSSEAKETQERLVVNEEELTAVIAVMHDLMQNLVNKSVIAAKQMMKFSFEKNSPLHNLPEDINARIFQFLSLEPACDLATIPAGRSLIEAAIEKAADSPTILKLSGELWELNGPKALAEKERLDKLKNKNKDQDKDKVTEEDREKDKDQDTDKERETDKSELCKNRKFA